MEDLSPSVLGPAAIVVAAFVNNQKISPAEISALIATVSGAFSGLGGSAAEPANPVRLTPAQIRKSITPDALISFEDGRRYRTLKRHLTTRGMTAAQYKAKWGLPSDYPTTAASYSAMRSAMAKALGLGAVGRKKNQPAAATVAKAQSPPAPKPRRGRPKKTTP
jgi:predicted transcriptional regulator